jgi:2-oxoglutarate dehydrogenase complex dehydrogenase (E1) component-like enzyme
MDVIAVYKAVKHAAEKVRESGLPYFIEAVTYRFRGHSMADPEEYRTKDEVEEWRERDPIQAFAKRLQDEDVVSKDQYEELDEKAIETVDEAVRFADQSPFPDLDSLYDDVYVYNSDVPAWWTVDERSPEPHRGEQEREAGELPHQLAEAGAAYANVGDREARSRRQKEGDAENEGEKDDAGEGEQSGDEPEAEGGAD